MCEEQLKDIIREDKLKARMRVPAKEIVVWTTTKVIIIVIKSGRVVRYRLVKRIGEAIGEKRNLQVATRNNIYIYIYYGYFFVKLILFYRLINRKSFFR